MRMSPISNEKSHTSDEKRLENDVKSGIFEQKRPILERHDPAQETHSRMTAATPDNFNTYMGWLRLVGSLKS